MLHCSIAFSNKLLKNDIDESFVEIQRRIKVSLFEVLVSFVEMENPKKSREVIINLVDERIRGFITKMEAKDIVAALFPQENIYRELINVEIDVYNATVVLDLAEWLY